MIVERYPNVSALWTGWVAMRSRLMAAKGQSQSSQYATGIDHHSRHVDRSNFLFCLRITVLVLSYFLRHLISSRHRSLRGMPDY